MVVHLERTPGGARRVAEVVEVVRFARRSACGTLYALEGGALRRVAERERRVAAPVSAACRDGAVARRGGAGGPVAVSVLAPRRRAADRQGRSTRTDRAGRRPDRQDAAAAAPRRVARPRSIRGRAAPPAASRRTGRRLLRMGVAGGGLAARCEPSPRPVAAACRALAARSATGGASRGVPRPRRSRSPVRSVRRGSTTRARSRRRRRARRPDRDRAAPHRAWSSGAGASLDAALDGLRGAGAVAVARPGSPRRSSCSGARAATSRRSCAASPRRWRTTTGSTEEAHAATAQARVTSVMVLALPPAGMVLGGARLAGIARPHDRLAAGRRRSWSSRSGSRSSGAGRSDGWRGIGA